MTETFSPEKEQFFEDIDSMHLALTFDDVRLRTGHNHGNPLPEELDLTSSFTKNVGLKIPFVSAAMSSVTESEMAIAMAKMGGIGVIHSGMSIDEQRKEVRKVKFNTNALIKEPICVNDTDTLESILNRCDEKGYDFRTFPVLDSKGKFVGLVTQSQFDFNKEKMQHPVSEVMVKAEAVHSESEFTSVENAYEIMVRHNVKTLPIIDEEGFVLGMYIFSDVDRIFHDHGSYNVDSAGRLLVAAAIPTRGDVMERVAALNKYTDAFVIDTADGDADHVFELLEKLKNKYGQTDFAVGNISEGESALELARSGADGVKVGQGPGAICTTRRETGIGMPQVTAVWSCIKALRDEFPEVPVIADGGISEHGDIPIAIAAGANAVMMGKKLAGTQEAPGPVFKRSDGSLYKEFWGMGSKRELLRNAQARDRYGSHNGKIPLPEGIEARIPYEGSLEDVLTLCVQALEKGMRYAKSPSLNDHRLNARLKRISSAGLRESHPHDVEIINS